MPPGRMPIPRKPLPSRAAGPAPAAGFSQPFGSHRPMLSAPLEPPRYLAFGISFLVIYGLGSLLILIAALILGSVKGLERAAPILAVVGIFLLAYTGGAGFLCIMRNSAGLWMGLPLVGLGVLGGVLNIVRQPEIQHFFGFIINVALLVMCILDLRRYFAYKNEVAQRPSAYGREDYSMQANAYGAPSMQPGFAPPAVNYNQPYRQRQAPPTAKPNSAPSPRATVLNILALAASIETEHAPARLARARTAALKLMGEKNAPEIEQVLKSPVSVVDPHARLAELGPVIAGNAKLVESLRKCLVFVLQEGEALTLAGEQFLSNYDIAVDGSVES